MRFKIILIVLIVAAWFPVNLLNAEDEPRCPHLKKLIDRYAMVLPWESDSRHSETSAKAEEIAAEIRGLKLSKELVNNTESLISKLKACRQQPMSARWGMDGYLTDLRFRMKQDPAIHEKCEGIESLYSEVMRQCAEME